MKKFATLVLLATATLLSCTKGVEYIQTNDQQQIEGAWKVVSRSKITIDGPNKELVESIRNDYTALDVAKVPTLVFNRYMSCIQTSTIDGKPVARKGTYSISNGRLEIVQTDINNPADRENSVGSFLVAYKGENLLLTTDKESLIAEKRYRLKAKELKPDEVEMVNLEIKLIEEGITSFSVTMELTRVK